MPIVNKRKRLKKWIGLLEEFDDKKRLSAIRNLGRSGDPRVIESLVNKALQYKITPDIEACSEALIEMNDPLVERTLIRQLGDSFQTLRVNSAKVLAGIGKSEWQEIILGDEKDFMRIAESDHPQAIEPLKYAISHYDEKTRIAGANAISVLLGESQWPSVITGEEDDFNRLADWDHPMSTEILIAALRLLQVHYNWSDEAAALLSEKKDPRRKELLAGSIHDMTSCFIREGSADVLGRIGDTTSIEPLTQAISDFDRNVRVAAAKSIGMIGGEESIEPLSEALKDEDNHVRQWAAEALIQLAKDDFSLLTGKWKKVRKLIQSTHKDIYKGISETYSDCNNHKDQTKHIDTGIGLEIPPELKI